MEFIEDLNILSINLIIYLQNKFSSVDYVLYFFKQTDFSNLFYFLYPLLCTLSLSLGTTVLAALVICELGVTVLQWTIAGDRPYWWLYESPMYQYEDKPRLVQYPQTCHTDHGTSSKLISLNVALFLLSVKYINSVGLSYFPKGKYKKLLPFLVWFIFIYKICIVVLTELVLANHFLHQCFLGLIIGIASSKIVTSVNVKLIYRKREAFFVTLVLFAIIWMAHKFRNDPEVGIKKAIKWCTNRDYIVLNETPYYSIFRFTGLSLGLGLAVVSAFYKKYNLVRLKWKSQISLGILELAIGQTVYFMDKLLPKESLGTYYLLVFVLHVFLALMATSCLPRFVMAASRTKIPTKILPPAKSL